MVNRHEPLIKKRGVYFVKEQIIHEVEGAVAAVMQDKGSQNSCVRGEGLQQYQVSCVAFEKQNQSKRNDAVVQTVVEDPVDDGGVLAEAGAGRISAPCELSEIEKMKDELAHILCQPW